MTLIEAIRLRRSVRDYSGAVLTYTQRAAVLQAINTATAPFGPAPHIALRTFDARGPQRPGTYGTISGARDYLLMGYHDTDTAAIAAGFVMERVVLEATRLGLGTCWMAATFRSADFAKGVGALQSVPLRIVCQVGEPSGHSSLRHRLTCIMAGSRKRKPFGELFSDGDFPTPLSPAGRLGEALELMRLAPSSLNSQPWRALVSPDKSAIHFYTKAKGDLAMLDLGIGLCHFALGMAYTAPFFTAADAPPAHGLRYAISAKLNP